MPRPGLQIIPPMNAVTHCPFLTLAPGNSLGCEVLRHRGWHSLKQQGQASCCWPAGVNGCDLLNCYLRP